MGPRSNQLSQRYRSVRAVEEKDVRRKEGKSGSKGSGDEEEMRGMMPDGGTNNLPLVRYVSQSSLGGIFFGRCVGEGRAGIDPIIEVTRSQESEVRFLQDPKVLYDATVSVASLATSIPSISPKRGRVPPVILNEPTPSTSIERRISLMDAKRYLGHTRDMCGRGRCRR